MPGREPWRSTLERTAMAVAVIVGGLALLLYAREPVSAWAGAGVAGMLVYGVIYGVLAYAVVYSLGQMTRHGR